MRPGGIGLGLCALAAVLALRAQEDPLDTFDQKLTFSAWGDTWRVQLSGLVDAEGYEFQSPAPGFIASSGDTLFVPRLTLFLDGQAGAHIYFFAQTASTADSIRNRATPNSAPTNMLSG